MLWNAMKEHVFLPLRFSSLVISVLACCKRHYYVYYFSLVGLGVVTLVFLYCALAYNMVNAG